MIVFCAIAYDSKTCLLHEGVRLFFAFIVDFSWLVVVLLSTLRLWCEARFSSSVQLLGTRVGNHRVSLNLTRRPGRFMTSPHLGYPACDEMRAVFDSHICRYFELFVSVVSHPYHFELCRTFWLVESLVCSSRRCVGSNQRNQHLARPPGGTQHLFCKVPKRILKSSLWNRNKNKLCLGSYLDSEDLYLMVPGSATLSCCGNISREIGRAALSVQIRAV